MEHLMKSLKEDNFLSVLEMESLTCIGEIVGELLEIHLLQTQQYSDQFLR